MPSVSELHDEVDALTMHYRLKMLVHALVACGRVTDVACQYAGCKRKSRKFDATHSGGLAVDHVQSRKNGGSDRPDNLRLVHRGCNSHKGITEDNPDLMGRIRATRGDFSATMKEKWRDPEFRAMMLRSQRRAR